MRELSSSSEREAYGARSKKVTLRRPTLVSTKRGASLLALVRGPSVRVCRLVGCHHLRKRCVVVTRVVTARIATVTDVTVTNGTASGTVRITASTANAINRLADKKIASAGEVLGTGSTTPTVS